MWWCEHQIEHVYVGSRSSMNANEQIIKYIFDDLPETMRTVLVCQWIYLDKVHPLVPR